MRRVDPGNGALKPQDEMCRLIGDIFRSVREKRGMSLRALSIKMDRSVNAIRWHEAGTRLFRADDLHRAALAMGVAPASLCLQHADAAAINDQ